MSQELALKNDSTILIVDDEELMREVTCIMIEDHGGKALTAVDGLDAVEVFAEHVDEVTAVVMDFSMPRMNGYEALVELRKIRPEIPCVIVSGLALTPEIEEMKNKGEVVFLSKPFQEQDLIRVLNELHS